MWVIVILLIIVGVLFLANKFYQPSKLEFKSPASTSPDLSSNSSPPTSAAPDFTVTCYTSESDYQKANPRHTYAPNEVSTQFMKMLIYFGKADGQLREDEIRIIAEFLRAEQPEHKQSDTDYLIACIREIKPFTPDEYKQFRGYLPEETIKKVITWYELIASTQRANHPFEDHLLHELKAMVS